VETADGEIVLFLGDDTVPQPGWLAAHFEEHRLFGSRGPMATLGYTSFPPETDSPFRRFINEHGAQFGYSIIEDPTVVPFNFFYTSNISLPRVILERLGGFLEDFPSAAWEDIEFAYRAVREGLRLRYQPRARTLHYHSVQPRTFCRRQRTSGLSAAIFAGLHPELGDFLGLSRAKRRSPLQRLRRPLLAVFVEFGEHFEGVVPGRIYKTFLDECYLEGLAEGLHSR
jgi:GT2 family glycosyltransferase